MGKKRIRKITRVLAFIADRGSDGHAVEPKEVSEFLEELYPQAKPMPWYMLKRLEGRSLIKAKRRGYIIDSYKNMPKRYASFVVTSAGMKYLDSLEESGEHARTEMWVMHPGDDIYESWMGKQQPIRKGRMSASRPL